MRQVLSSRKKGPYDDTSSAPFASVSLTSDALIIARGGSIQGTNSGSSNDNNNNNTNSLLTDNEAQLATSMAKEALTLHVPYTMISAATRDREVCKSPSIISPHTSQETHHSAPPPLISVDMGRTREGVASIHNNNNNVFCLDNSEDCQGVLEAVLGEMRGVGASGHDRRGMAVVLETSKRTIFVEPLVVGVGEGRNNNNNNSNNNDNNVQVLKPSATGSNVDVTSSGAGAPIGSTLGTGVRGDSSVIGGTVNFIVVSMPARA
eukprot:Tbor_TRINITY_DN5516_c0_g1::TRINITY_DN5516_c0_g1_i1::g.13393::m.13393